MKSNNVVRLFLSVSFILVAGCDKGNDNGAGGVGEAIGENVTEFAKGIGKGVDNRMQVSIEISRELAELGLSSTVAKQAQLEFPNEDPKSISVYCIATSALDATLIAKAYNADDQEIGRAKTSVNFSDDDAQYIGFSFPSEMDRQLVSKYLIDIVNVAGQKDAQ